MFDSNSIVCGDCVKTLSDERFPKVDLVFADPPFNIGYKYDFYQDRKAYDEYTLWSEQWMHACANVMKPNGSFWVAIGDDYAAEIRIIGRKLGLNLRNWVVWHYTFGQATKTKFARAHTHLFYFTKDVKDFTFNDMAVRIPSDRLRQYNDKRANLDGKLPDDVWAEFPRLCGTFVEREQWHPCQMPENILERIIRVSSNPGDLVLDPFSGSGTTLAAAKKLSRNYIGLELSENYADGIKKRLHKVVTIDNSARDNFGWPADHTEQLKGFYAEAGVTTDQLYQKRVLLDSFAKQFNARLKHAGSAVSYTTQRIFARLENLRKGVQLGIIKTHADESQKLPPRDLVKHTLPFGS